MLWANRLWGSGRRFAPSQIGNEVGPELDQLRGGIEAALKEQDFGMLSQVMGFNEAQQKLLHTMVRLSDEMGLLILDLDDVHAMLGYLADHIDELSTKDGKISKNAIETVQRKMATLQKQLGPYSRPPAEDILRLKEKEANGIGKHSAAVKEPIEKLLQELDRLAGTEEAKAKVHRLITLARANQERRKRGLKVPDQSYHLVFTGNPGTGKTTFARLIGRVFYSLGYLSKGHLVEVDRGGLVAGYLGQTAIKTKEVIERAKGGVLFIDEVYALAARDDQFGQEAIETLLKVMEDDRTGFIVIVAGYPREMDTFLDANPGLRSRFRETIVFGDFSAEQLYQVFQGMVAQMDWTIADDAKDAVRQYINEILVAKNRSFGNAREMRTLLERCTENQAERISLNRRNTDRDLTTLQGEDVWPLIPSSAGKPEIRAYR